MVKDQEIILKSKLAEGLRVSMTPVCLELFYINPCLNEYRFEFYTYVFSFHFSKA